MRLPRVAWVAAMSLGVSIPASLSPANDPPPASCPITTPSAPAFVPPAPYPPQAPYEAGWHGTPEFWTAVDGNWYKLPRNKNGYRQKVWWWRPGYNGAVEQTPALTVTGRRLDSPGVTFVAPRSSNGYHEDFGGWAMITGVDVPTLGCWEITGCYGSHELSFVVSVTP
jgi:hypothetical protein